jgi:hypothetical protein
MKAAMSMLKGMNPEHMKKMQVCSINIIIIISIINGNSIIDCARHVDAVYNPSVLSLMLFYSLLSGAIEGHEAGGYGEDDEVCSQGTEGRYMLSSHCLSFAAAVLSSVLTTSSSFAPLPSTSFRSWVPV